MSASTFKISRRRPGRARIISGQWRGRKLSVLNTSDLRPTPDRIRETLFNWLQASVTGAHCLDLFAGTGALGFEALSRGATEVTMIDSNPRLVELLKHHARILGSKNHIIERADAIRWLGQGIRGFDFIFLDPPFGGGYIEQCCKMISQRSLLNDKGMIYIESEKGLVQPDGWKIDKQTKVGNVQAMLIQEPI